MWFEFLICLQEVLSPFLGLALFKIILAWADADIRCDQPGFDGIEIGGYENINVGQLVLSAVCQRTDFPLFQGLRHSSIFL